MLEELDKSFVFPRLAGFPELAKDVLGGRFGLIRRVHSISRSSADPMAFHVTAEPADISGFNVVPASNFGAASSLTLPRAAIKAVGEAVERYCGAMYNPMTFVHGSFHELSKAGCYCLDPTKLVLFSKRQYGQTDFPFAPFTRDTRAAWVPGYSLTNRTSAFIPAAFTYVPYDFGLLNEAVSHMPISTGLACGPSRSFAIFKALMEVIERDAFMTCWHRRRSLTKLTKESFRSNYMNYERAITPTGADWHIYDLPSDVIDIPIVMTLLRNPVGLPKTSFGAAAHWDFDSAIQSSCEESLLTRFYINQLQRSGCLRQFDDYDEVRTLSHHAIVHALDLKLMDASHFLDGEPAEAFPENTVKESLRLNGLQCLIKDLENSGFEVFGTDVSTPDIAELGFSVVRVIVPGLQPLDSDHRYRHEGGTRLQGENNCLPHPFP